jgi:hypothetical protein
MVYVLSKHGIHTIFPPLIRAFGSAILPPHVLQVRLSHILASEADHSIKAFHELDFTLKGLNLQKQFSRV